MTKEFVPYEPALELKELGFDEPCFGKWLSSLQSNWKEYELILEMGMSEEFEDNRNIHLLEGACSAPLYQQAFRWFREKYNLNHVITVADFGKYESGNPDFQCAIYSKDPLLITNMDKYNTYEEAELACLRKLIEIVKQNG